jgi:hypothetical protein
VDITFALKETSDTEELFSVIEFAERLKEQMAEIQGYCLSNTRTLLFYFHRERFSPPSLPSLPFKVAG